MKLLSMQERWRNRPLNCPIVKAAVGYTLFVVLFICAVPSRTAPSPQEQQRQNSLDQLPVYGLDQLPVYRRPRPVINLVNREIKLVNREIKGVASWYGVEFAGKRTASSEVFNPEKLTAASLDLPLGSDVLVTNLSNGRSVHVKINDCGPYVDGRDIDLSRKAARRLNFVRAGVAPVKIKVLWIPLGAERCDDGSEMQS
jgi:rare lipoprotein A (peptidoglycan hydrolase)